MQGYWLEWGTFSTIAISGKSGSGKTSTIRFIITQMILNGVKTIVCDPHGNAGTGSLKDSIEPIEHLLAMPIAITLEDRIKAFKAVNKILRARIDGTDTSIEKICIILDEATLHFLECSKEQSHEFTRFLMDLTNEGRKKNICCFLLAQNWKSDFIGSRSVRSSITHIIFHRTSEDETKLFIPAMPAKEKRIISQLPTGHIFVFPFMYRLRVPYISQDDMIDFARSFKRATMPTIAHDDSHAESRLPRSNHDNDKKPESKLAWAVKETISCKIDGMNKEQTIYHVFQIRKSGKSERWNIASRFYDNVMRRYEEQNKK